MAAFIDTRGIAGIKPAVSGDHRRGRLVVVPVAQHDVGAADQQSPQLAKANLDSGHHGTNTRRQIVTHAVGTGHRAGFRHAIALQEIQPKTDKNTRHIGRQRRTAGERGAQITAEPRQYFFRH